MKIVGLNKYFLTFEIIVEVNEQSNLGDLFKFRVNWQKAMFVFDEMDRRNIDYNQIALVDSSAMIKWDAPNFFDMTDNRTDKIIKSSHTMDFARTFFIFLI